jgi:hypothetical protein
MYSAKVPGRDDRREDPRIRLEMFLNEYVKEQSYRALAVNVSSTGVYLQRLADPTARRSNSVGLEFELPGTNEVIWARAEPRFDWIAGDFHQTGLRFTAMARKHERLVRDFVREKDWLLERMWLRLRFGHDGAKSIARSRS